MAELEEGEVPVVLATVTCHTPGCGNAETGLEVWVTDTPDPLVVCGPCGQQITDIQHHVPTS
jgi:uncharacterized Zn finger protein